MRRLLLGLVVAVATLVPNLATANDQAIARHIMSTLQLEQQRGALKGFHVDMRVDQGTVWYEGFVSTQEQKNLILLTAQRAKHLGVVQVVDDIDVRGGEMTQQQPMVAQAQPMAAQAQPLATEAQPMEAEAQQLAQAAYTQDYAVPPRPDMTANNMPLSQQQYQAAQAQAAQARAAQAQAAQYRVAQAQAAQAQAAQAAQAQAIQSQYRNASAASQVAMQSPVGAPMAMAQTAMAPMPTSGDSASLPGYAWPSYAAHPNYGAVTYPRQYSASAWPYIGPFYPYPQVPLGWRKVTMEWDDGWWWLDFNNR